MLPLLKLLNKPDEVELNVATKSLAQHFNLTPEEETQLLPNGETLAQLMIENSVGVSSVISYDVKRIDSDYFSDEV